ncbi:YciI family protein [Micromonospora lupini]|uniref:YciI family protein n=1 Tax=Micromonospora lupini TaxID=285679 RepID=UPI0033F9BA93
MLSGRDQTLAESGELVDARGLSEPVHARRVQVRDGASVVTDGPYPETQEVLAGYTIVECASFDRATEIAAGLERVGERVAARDAYRMAAARSTNLAQQRYLNARADRLADDPPPAG